MKSLLQSQDKNMVRLAYLANIAFKHGFDTNPTPTMMIVAASFLNEATPIGIGYDDATLTKVLSGLLEGQNTFRTQHFTIEKHPPYGGTRGEAMPRARYTFTPHRKECIVG